MHFPYQETPEKIELVIGRKIEYFSILLEDETPLVPAISWLKTNDGVWHRFFIDVWMLHWSEMNEEEAKESIEEDFEDGIVKINDDTWVVRNIMDELNLEGQEILDAQSVYFKKEKLICCQLQLKIETGITLYFNDYGDESKAELIIKKTKTKDGL